MKAYLLCLLSLLVSASLVAQKNKIPKELLKMSYERLSKEYYKNEQNKTKAELIAKTYLQKGKNERDTLRIANGYYFLSYFYNNTPLQITYLDSIIAIPKNTRNNLFIMECYLNKGVYYYNKRNFIKAIDFYTLTYNEAKKTKNQHFLNRSIQCIAILKLRTGEYEEAINMFNLSTAYLLKEKDTLVYLGNLISLSEAYIGLRKYHESSLLNKKGYAFGIKCKSNGYFNYFATQEGIINYHQKNYKTSLDSLQKAMPFFKKINDLANISVCNDYLGRNFYGAGNKIKAITYFKKVDSIFNITNDLYPDNRPVYEYLINHYKEKGDIKNQLYYIEQLLKVDKILDKNYKYLSRKINNEYDTPLLLHEKETIIHDLSSKYKTSTIQRIVLVSVLLLLALLFWFYYKKQKKRQANFEKLLLASTHSLETKTLTKAVAKQETNTELNLQEHIVTDLLQKLTTFEKELSFLKNDCTLAKISRDFETNPNYLSKVINAKKQMSFTSYINDLRIDYAVVALQNAKK
jgi:AraC-like DNA-binding protein